MADKKKFDRMFEILSEIDRGEKVTLERLLMRLRHGED